MIRVEEYKHPQENFAAEKAQTPKRLVIPVSQHIGKPSIPIVNKQDKINQYQIVAKADGLISTNIHSPLSGEVLDIKEYNHPLFKKNLSIIIKTGDSPETQKKEDKITSIDIKKLTKEFILEKIKESGIVGLGGATFPTHVKLSPTKKIDTLIINGAECEPFLTCDFRLMIEKTDQLINGIEIVSKLLDVKKVIIAIEDNKKEAIKKLNSKLHTKKYNLPATSVEILACAYPQGAEKQLVYNLLRRKIPAGKLPLDVGVVIHNVATCFAIYRAIYKNIPLTERIMTFAGGALVKPKNLWVKTGTLLSDLIEQKDIELKKDPKKIIFGGPMMGISVPSTDFPLLKGTSGVLFLTEEELDFKEEQECIRCARCVEACPMNLLPLTYVNNTKNLNLDELSDKYINDCIECGSCAYVCPAKIPIVNYVKLGKEHIRKQCKQ